MPRPERSPVAVVAVSALAVGTGSAMGFMYGFVAPDLRRSLDIGRAEVGLLVSVYFGATGVASIWGGRLSDRIGARRAVRADMLVVAAMATASAVTPGYLPMLVFGAVAGAGYSLANAGTNHAVGHAVAPRRRGIALNAKTTGVPLLVAVGAFFGPALADAVGWRWTYAAVGAWAIFALVLSSAFLPDAAATRMTGRGDLPAGFWRYPLACCLMLIGSQPVYSWSVSYLVDVHSTTKGTAGAIVAAASLVGVAAMAATGRVSDHLGEHTRRPLVAALCGAVGAACALLALGTSLSTGLLIVSLVVAVAAQLAAIGTMHASLVDVARGAIGRASGVTMTGYYLGALVAPVLFGAIADGPGYATAWAVCAASCAAASAVFVSSRRIQASVLVDQAAAVNTTG